MPKYSLTITFDTDRELDDNEMSSLIGTLIPQLEEPMSLDMDTLDFADATYSTSNIDITDARLS